MGNLLDETEREKRKRDLHPDWHEREGALARSVDCKSYPALARLVAALAEYAETANHHPDIRFGWGCCEVIWSTHSACGITEKDFAAAAETDRLVDECLPGAQGAGG